MDFEEVMAKMGETEGFGTEAQDAIKDRLSKANNEAKNQRKRRKEAEAKSKINPALEALKANGFEIDEDDDVNESVSNFIKSLTEKSKSNDTNSDITKDPAYVKMQKQLDKLTKANEESELKNKMLTEKNKKTKIENALQKQFGKEIANGETVLNLLINSNKNPFDINDSDEVILKLSDGDEISGVNDIIAEYKKQHPGQVLNNAINGNDTKPGDNFKVPKKFSSIEQIKQMTPEQINKLTPEQHAQMMSVVAENTNN